MAKGEEFHGSRVTVHGSQVTPLTDMLSAEVRPLHPSTTERALIDGPAGCIEIDLNDPGPQRRGLALIAHPNPLRAVFGWARPQGLPVVVVPGGDHFFHGRLGQLSRIVLAWCR